jgi:hypothetical protein
MQNLYQDTRLNQCLSCYCRSPFVLPPESYNPIVLCQMILNAGRLAIAVILAFVIASKYNSNSLSIYNFGMKKKKKFLNQNFCFKVMCNDLFQCTPKGKEEPNNNFESQKYQALALLQVATANSL